MLRLVLRLVLRLCFDPPRTELELRELELRELASKELEGAGSPPPLCFFLYVLAAALKTSVTFMPGLDFMNAFTCSLHAFVLAILRVLL